MKRAPIVLAMLALAILGWGQQTPDSGTPAAGQNSPAPSTQQSGGAQAAAPEQPAGKRPPQAKTQPEYDAFNAAKATAGGADAMDKAADDFAAKFPDSELRILLYEQVMGLYQQGNDAEKMETAARKVLAIDPDQPDALIAVAAGLVERTHDSDLDKDQHYAEAAKDAQRALETIDTDLSVPAGTPPERVEGYKGLVRSSAYSILGTLQFKQQKYAEAADYYQKSIDAFPSQPDPVVVLRLALALDQQGKYKEALPEAERAVQLTQDNDTIGSYARKERDRLVQLTGGSTLPAPTKPAGTAPSPAPPK
jgi:tetratricopeptide (TPR) repeat protein